MRGGCWHRWQPLETSVENKSGSPASTSPLASSILLTDSAAGADYSTPQGLGTSLCLEHNLPNCSQRIAAQPS